MMKGFTVQLADFAKKTRLRADTVVRKVVLDIGASVVEKTPVGDPAYWRSPPPPGYTGGHARANWHYSSGTLDRREIPGVDKNGTGTLSAIQSGYNKNETVHILQNNVPYIERLEDGYSRQAPNGMVALTAQKFQAYVNDAVKGARG